MKQVTFGNGATRGRRIPDSEDKPISKAMTSTAMASIAPKSAGTTSSTPPSATPVKTKGLKPTGNTVQGAASGGVGKAYRSWDPESARVHRQSMAQGGLAAGGVALAASGASAPKKLTPHKGLERLSDPKLVLSQTYESGTPGRDGKVRAKSGIEGHAGGRKFTAAERKGLEGTRKMTRSAKGRIGLGAAALGGAAGLRRFTNDKANRQYY